MAIITYVLSFLFPTRRALKYLSWRISKKENYSVSSSKFLFGPFRHHLLPIPLAQKTKEKLGGW